MGATNRVVDWIVSTTYEDIPPEAIRVAKEVCFDCIGVMLAGSVQPVGEIMQKFTRDAGGSEEATVVGTNMRTSAVSAALANGTMAHALDFDDVGGFGHPTTVLLPAILALAEKSGASGKDVLEAYVVGFEVAANLSGGAHYNQMSSGWHSTAIIGTLAATAAACKLLKLDKNQTEMALGIAGS